jgi:hypothetical protein
MAQFLEVFERHPTLLYEFGGDLLDVARAMGGETWLGYQVACLRAALSDTPDTGDDDYIREIYSELLEDYAEDPAALERIRQLGKVIDAAAREGKLPRALVRRGGSRSRDPA